jgi:hypothetical protein
VCCCLFLWLGRSMLASPYKHMMRIYHNAGLHLAEATMWLYTSFVLLALVLGVVDDHDSPLDIIVPTINITSVLFNSLCTSYAAHMNLALTADDDDDSRQRMLNDPHGQDQEQRTRFAAIIAAKWHTISGHSAGMRAMVRCIFVHNATLFLADAVYEVALVSKHDNETSHRVMVLLTFFAVWYRGSQANFWFKKNSFPHANVMLPRYDGATVHRASHLRDDINSYA